MRFFREPVILRLTFFIENQCLRELYHHVTLTPDIHHVWEGAHIHSKIARASVSSHVAAAHSVMPSALNLWDASSRKPPMSESKKTAPPMSSGRYANRVDVLIDVLRKHPTRLLNVMSVWDQLAVIQNNKNDIRQCHLWIWEVHVMWTALKNGCRS